MGYKVKRIMVWQNGVEKQVRPQRWKPTSNTIVYYEFNNNLQDSINNSHPLSLTQGATQYDTIGIRKCFTFNGSTYLSATPMIPNSGPFTISCWCLWASKNISGNVGQAYYQQFNGGAGSQYNSDAISMYERTGTLRSWGRGTGDLDTGYSLAINTWYNIIFTYTSGTLKIYVNGTLVSTQSRTINTVSPVYFWIGRRGEYSSGTVASTYLVANGGKVSELFAENKTWTATDVSNYYNLTKSNYGL